MSLEEHSMPATKGDIIRLQEDIRELTKTIITLSKSVAILEAKPENPRPCKDFVNLKEQFERFQDSHSPCKELLEHVQFHRELMADIRQQVIGVITKAVLALIGLYAIGWVISEIKGL